MAILIIYDLCDYSASIWAKQEEAIAWTSDCRPSCVRRCLLNFLLAFCDLTILLPATKPQNRGFTLFVSHDVNSQVIAFLEG